MRPLRDVRLRPDIDGQIDGLEEGIAAYEAERPDDTLVANALRRMPRWWAAQMLSIRAHAKSTRRWSASDGDYSPLRATHAPGLHEERIDGVAPDVHAKRNGGKPFACDQCGGVRFMRMINHHPASVEVATENPRVTHTYEPGESYMVPCDRCSEKRYEQWKNRKPLKSKDEPLDLRKPREVED